MLRGSHVENQTILWYKKNLNQITHPQSQNTSTRHNTQRLTTNSSNAYKFNEAKIRYEAALKIAGDLINWHTSQTIRIMKLNAQGI